MISSEISEVRTINAYGFRVNRAVLALFCSIVLLTATSFSTLCAYDGNNIPTVTKNKNDEYISIYTSFGDVYPIAIVRRLIGGSKIKHSQAFVAKSEFCFIDSVFKTHMRKICQDDCALNQNTPGTRLCFFFKKKTGKTLYTTSDFHLAALELIEIRKELSYDTKHLSVTSKSCVTELLTSMIDRIYD